MTEPVSPAPLNEEIAQAFRQAAGDAHLPVVVTVAPEWLRIAAAALSERGTSVAQPVAWIATRGSTVHHFSVADGWKVEVVLEAPPSAMGEKFTLRWLQDNLPWTIAYSPEFESSALWNARRRTTHDVLHVMKSLGRIAAECEASDHGGTKGLTGAALAKEVADLVICALHIARLHSFDLQDAVIDNSSLRNGVNLRSADGGAKL